MNTYTRNHQREDGGAMQISRHWLNLSIHLDHYIKMHPIYTCMHFGTTYVQGYKRLT